MSTGALDWRLAQDCFVLGRIESSRLLLMNNALVPWFILVPRTPVKDMTDMPMPDQQVVLAQINRVSRFIKDNFPVSKLNIASIGNVVSQLHVHVIGRDPSDRFWPHVVWGQEAREPYETAQVERIATAAREQIGLCVE